jgi:hypothetical protein
MSREAWPYNPKTLCSFLKACLIRFHLDACHSFTPLFDASPFREETKPAIHGGLFERAQPRLKPARHALLQPLPWRP